MEATRRLERPAGAAVDPAEGASHGDLRQAEYYQEMLEELRAAVNDELAHHYASMAVRESTGDASGVRRSQRIIRVKEAELAAIDQLTDALNSRFPTSRIHHQNQDPLPGEVQSSFARHQPSSSPPRQLPMTLDSPCPSEATVSEYEGAPALLVMVEDVGAGAGPKFADACEGDQGLTV